jgi:hypothetical protein
MYNKNIKAVVGITLFLLIMVASSAAVLAAEQTKSYRWTVDRQMQLAGLMLEPGRYDVQVTCFDNQRAQIVVLLKDRVLIKTDALLEQKTEASEDEGVRVILPDGRTRVVQKLWFRGGKYLLNLEIPTNIAVTDVKPRP